MTFKNGDLRFKLYKDPAVNILLFSAAAEASYVGGVFEATPEEITRKYIWRPKTPEISDEVMRHLTESNVSLDRDSLLFLFELCGEHFGVIVFALLWVQLTQKDQSAERAKHKIMLPEKWDYATTVNQVRKSIALGWSEPKSFLNCIAKSRAIKVNGGGDVVNPEELFVRILFTGPARIGGTDHRALTNLAIKGMLFPIPDQPTKIKGLNFFVMNDNLLFGVPHPLMRAYYQEQFKIHNWKPYIGEHYYNPTTCLDLLARVVPHLSFLNLVCAPVLDESTMSKHSFPHELQFQYAILKQLWRLDFQTLTIINNRKDVGQPDIIVTRGKATFVMELVLASRSEAIHEEHLLRFKIKRNYNSPLNQCILTIGTESEVLKKLELLAKLRKNNGLHSVNVLGLVPTRGFYNYTIYTKTRVQTKRTRIPVDGVSRSIVHNKCMPVVQLIRLKPQTEFDELQKQNLQLQLEVIQLKHEVNRLQQPRREPMLMPRVTPTASPASAPHDGVSISNASAPPDGAKAAPSTTY